MAVFKLRSEEGTSKLERIYINYRNMMFKEALSILRDPHDAEDAVQQAFVKLMKCLDKIREDNIGMTCNFLKMVVRNVAKDSYKKKLYLNTKEDTIDILEDTANHREVTDIVIEKESINRIKDEIKKLPTIYRDILLAEKVYGFSKEDAMKLLDVNYETRKKRMTRAKTKLLEALRKEELNNGRENLRKNAR